MVFNLVVRLYDDQNKLTCNGLVTISQTTFCISFGNQSFASSPRRVSTSCVTKALVGSKVLIDRLTFQRMSLDGIISKRNCIRLPVRPSVCHTGEPHRNRSRYRTFGPYDRISCH